MDVVDMGPPLTVRLADILKPASVRSGALSLVARPRHSGTCSIAGLISQKNEPFLCISTANLAAAVPMSRLLAVQLSHLSGGDGRFSVKGGKGETGRK